MDHHGILSKQISKLLPSHYLEDEAMLTFLESVSKSYFAFERAKKISEHAFTISEREYQEVNNYLLTENQIKQRSISEIKKAISSLAPGSVHDIDGTEEDLIQIIKFLQQQIGKAKELESQLILSKEIAEKAASSKSQFLSTMSHEIRTPMNAVIGFTHLLLQTNPREEQMEYLNLLKFSAENLLVLINDILDFSKIESGKVELEEQDLSIKDLLCNIRLALLNQASEKGIQLSLLLDPELPETIKGDPVRIGQILTNLISNAVKFTVEGKVTVIASPGQKSHTHTAVNFEVADTGIGIAADKLDHIFESFMQASTDTTRIYGGTGLGLTITKKLLELMGSQIHVKSEPGKGSTFYFTLRMRNSSTAPNAERNEGHLRAKDLKGMKVLIAEDNTVNVLLARQFLKLWGITCEVALNGKIALDMVQANDYDLVLMDLQMPEMDGYQSTIEIRKLPGKKYRDLPIIALTASALDNIKDSALQVGMNDYVSKPFNPDELYRKIAQYAKAASTL